MNEAILITSTLIFTAGFAFTCITCVDRYCIMKEYIHSHSDDYRP